MALMTWDNEKFATNVSAADEQHQEIFRLVNVLDESLAGDRAVVEQNLDALVAYVVDHFATEEKYFQETEYPTYAEHKKMHDDLVAAVSDIVGKFKAGEAEITPEITAYVRDWLYGHIPNTDKQYGPYLNEKGIQ